MSMNNETLSLTTNVDVLDLGTAATPPGFWPAVRRPLIRRRDREAIMAAIDRALALPVDACPPGWS
jgi:hypothetical protein